MPIDNDKLRPNPFAGDRGDCPPEIAAALEVEGTGPRLEAVVRALASARVLVPVLAHEHPGRTADGGAAPHETMRKDACSSAAMIAVEAPDGRAAMPIFSSADRLVQWNRTARPVPVHAQNAAIAAVSEADGLLVLDPGTPEPILLGRPAVSALATGEEWVPPWRDESLPQVITAALAGIPGLRGLRIMPGRKAETAIVLAVDGEASRESVSQALTEAQNRIALIDELVGKVDSVELAPARTVTNATAG